MHWSNIVFLSLHEKVGIMSVLGIFPVSYQRFADKRIKWYMREAYADLIEHWWNGKRWGLASYNAEFFEKINHYLIVCDLCITCVF